MGGPLCVWGLQGLKPDIDFAGFSARVNSCPDTNHFANGVFPQPVKAPAPSAKNSTALACFIPCGSATPVEDQKETEVQVPQNIGAEKRPGAKARFMLAFDSGA